MYEVTITFNSSLLSETLFLEEKPEEDELLLRMLDMASEGDYYHPIVKIIELKVQSKKEGSLSGSITIYEEDDDAIENWDFLVTVDPCIVEELNPCKAYLTHRDVKIREIARQAIKNGTTLS